MNILRRARTSLLGQKSRDGYTMTPPRLPNLLLATALTLLVVPVLLFVLFDSSRDIAAQDLPEVGVLGDNPVSEGDTIFFTLVHDRLEQPIRVSVMVTQEGNYLASRELGRRTVTLRTAPYSQTKIRIPTLDNNQDEANGSVTVRVNSGSGYQIMVDGPNSYQTATTVVEDNDEPAIAIADPSISVSSGSAIVEGGTATFTLTGNPKPLSPVTVNVDVSQHGDFLTNDQLGRQKVTIGTNGRGTLSLTIEDDQQDEPDGSVTVKVVGGDGYTLDSSMSITVEVTDGGAPTPRMSIAASPAIDEGGTATFTLTANPAPESEFYVDVTIVERGDFGASATGKHAVLIGTDGRGTLSVSTVNDGLNERNGAITVNLVAGTEYLLAPPTAATVNVRDLGAPVVTITRNASGVIEGDAASFTLKASPKPISSIRVEVNWTGAGDFFNGLQSHGESFTIGTNGVATLRVYTYDDNVDERNGSVNVKVSPGDGYTVGWPSSATMTVNDNDAAPSERTVSVSDAEVQENPRTGTYSLEFNVRLSRPADRWIEVSYETRETTGDHAATRGEDYRHARNAVSFLPGETVKRAVVGVLDDDEEEAKETLELVLTNVIGPAEIADGVATGTILPDPFDATRPTPVFTIDVQPAVVEGQSFLYMLTAMPPPEDDLEIDIRIIEGCDGGELYDSDFVAGSDEGERTITYLGDASLIWRLPDGENYTRQAYWLDTVDDLVDEPDGPVCIEVVAPDDGRYTVGSTAREAVIVYDNDGSAPTMPEVFISDGNAGQGADEGDTVVFDVSLSRPVHPDGKVTVRYYTVGASARSNVDFTVTTGTLTFYGNEDYQSVVVPIIDDDVSEQYAELFFVKLWGAEGATIGDRLGLAYIRPSDID